MNTARLLVVRPTADDDSKITVTIRGPMNADAARVLKVLTHLLGSGDEWDGPVPNVELVLERDIEAAA